MDNHQKIRLLLALAIMVFIPFGLMIWIRTHQSSGFASLEMILYPILLGGGSILVLNLLKKYFLKSDFSDFNSGTASSWNDLGWGIGLTAIYFALFFLSRGTLSNVLTFHSNREMLDLMLQMRDSPLLLVLWFGPVLWVGIALYEELIRVFILTSLWKFSKNTIWTLAVILIASILIGLVHWSQGSYGVVTIAVKSIVACYFFFRKRRLIPLVYAHVLYDGLQVALLLITYPD